MKSNQTALTSKAQASNLTNEYGYIGEKGDSLSPTPIPASRWISYIDSFYIFAKFWLFLLPSGILRVLLYCIPSSKGKKSHKKSTKRLSKRNQSWGWQLVCVGLVIGIGASSWNFNSQGNHDYFYLQQPTSLHNSIRNQSSQDLLSAHQKRFHANGRLNGCWLDECHAKFGKGAIQ